MQPSWRPQAEVRDIHEPLTDIGTGEEECPSVLSVTVIDTMARSNLKRRGFIWLTVCSPSWKEAESGTEAWPQGNSCWLSPCDLLCLLSFGGGRACF